MPKRLKRSRVKGWRKPDNAVIVDRTSRWGNPFKVGDPGVPDAATAVALYRQTMIPYTHQGQPATGSKLIDYLVSESFIQDAEEALRGRDLICFCDLDAPCHADVLLEIANAGSAPDA